MINIYTSQIRYSGEDRLDITVKSAKGRASEVVPTWRMVIDFKDKKINEKEYTRLYNVVLKNLDKSWWEEYLPSVTVNNEITFVCYCRKDDFCHRVLLAKWLEKNKIGLYKGER